MVAIDVFNGVRRMRKATPLRLVIGLDISGQQSGIFSSSLLFRYSLFFSDIFNKFMSF